VSEDYRELLIGCGRARKKLYTADPTHPRSWRAPRGPVTLDINRSVNPDLWCDLNATPPWRAQSRGDGPFHEMLGDYWDEIHAYQVLEHLGSQGDAHAFFAHFSEIWRLLKPQGYLVASVPSRFSPWLWGDPSHRRAILTESLVFLDQSEYIKQCDVPHPTPMSDFRDIYRADFRIVAREDNRMDHVFVLQAVKPSRWCPLSMDGVP
jgi:hypothetical protein